MTDELKTWAEEQAYERAKAEYVEKLNGIRAEIETIIGERNWDDYDFCSGLICARKIIDKYRTEREGEG